MIKKLWNENSKNWKSISFLIVKRIIDKEPKYIYFILIIGLTKALSDLEIYLLFAIMGDCYFRAIIKDFEEPHSI